MRTVGGAKGVVWICLELPPRPGAPESARVLVECNSGADRVTIEVDTGWDTSLDDAALVRTIEGKLASG